MFIQLQIITSCNPKKVSMITSPYCIFAFICLYFIIILYYYTLFVLLFVHVCNLNHHMAVICFNFINFFPNCRITNIGFFSRDFKTLSYFPSKIYVVVSSTKFYMPTSFFLYSKIKSTKKKTINTSD